MQASSLRRGMAVIYEGQLFLVTEFAHRTPGNLRAFVQVTLKNLGSGKVIQQRFSATADVELARLDKKKAQFSYSDREGFHFMDMEDYQMYTLNQEDVGDDKYYLKENQEVELLFHEGKIINMELPKHVCLKVIDSPVGLKGDSVSNNTKVATLETGLKVNIPLFITEGTILKIDTETGKYLGRD